MFQHPVAHTDCYGDAGRSPLSRPGFQTRVPDTSGYNAVPWEKEPQWRLRLCSQLCELPDVQTPGVPAYAGIPVMSPWLQRYIGLENDQGNPSSMCDRRFLGPVDVVIDPDISQSSSAQLNRFQLRPDEIQSDAARGFPLPSPP